jgi:hypothetical protein
MNPSLDEFDQSRNLSVAGTSHRWNKNRTRIYDTRS